MRGPQSLNNLVLEFKKLPGVGRKTAERLAFFIMRAKKEQAFCLSNAIVQVKERITSCSICCSITENDPCEICSDQRRNRELICVVEDPHDVFAIEKTKGFRGLYHVLMGAISPLDGIEPSDLTIEELGARVRDGNVTEVIIATNPNTEGETTAMYLSKYLGEFGTKVTRIARGLPVGGDLEYADEVTLSLSFQGRQEM